MGQQQESVNLQLSTVLFNHSTFCVNTFTNVEVITGIYLWYMIQPTATRPIRTRTARATPTPIPTPTVQNTVQNTVQGHADTDTNSYSTEHVWH